MPVTTKSLTLSDGRVADVFLGGDPTGDPLVMHHGTPGDSTLFANWHEACEARGIRLICASRPGYATSTRTVGRSVAQVASDVSGVLDLLGHTHFMTAGWSGGGPYALACAAILSERCTAAATLAGIGPFGAAGLDFFDGMDESGITEFHIAHNGEEALRKWTQEQADRSIGDLVADVDSTEPVSAAFHRALEHGLDGWIDDDLAFTKHWGFEPCNIRVPVTVWQGDLDPLVPLVHGRWLVEHIPKSLGKVLRGQGHFFPLVPHYRDDVLEDLQEHLTHA